MTDDVECLPTSVSMAFWFGFVVLLLVSASVYVVAELFPRKYRSFHYSMVLFTGISSLAYLAQANGMGILVIDNARCFYALRWVDLMLTLPIALLALSLVSTTYASSTLFLMGMSSLMVTASFLGGFVRGQNHWLFFAFNVLAFVPIARALLFGFRMDASSLMDDVEVEKRSVLLSSIVFGYLLVYHTMYVLVQSLGVMNSDTDALIMTIGDVATKAMFAVLLLSHRHVLDTIVDLWDEQSAATAMGSGGGAGTSVGGGGGSFLAPFGHVGEPSTTKGGVGGGTGAGGMPSRETSALLRRARGTSAMIPGMTTTGVPVDLYVTSSEGGITSGGGGGGGGAGLSSASGYYQGGGGTIVG